ncbi:MAG: hypothetical protein HC767_03210 [Akkermansiaceae bacterium]|nr:hypothetical protein [Akkermansiaceae bacterium]
MEIQKTKELKTLVQFTYFVGIYKNQSSRNTSKPATQERKTTSDTQWR